MKAIQNFLFLAPSSHTLPLRPRRHCLFMSPPPFFSLAPHRLSLHQSHRPFSSEGHCWTMNGVSSPQRLPCFTDALASGRTPSSAGKHARNARNGAVNDKKEIPRSRPD